jgi:hypothetical protein
VGFFIYDPLSSHLPFGLQRFTPVFGMSIEQENCSIFDLTSGGNTHHYSIMPTTKAKPRQKRGPTVVERYDVAADAKKRINLRNAKTKYFHVKALSNGAYVLEPRVLVPPAAISARTMKMIERSAANLKKGRASAPIDFASLPKV